MTTAVALIPARSGSQRVVDKNVRLLGSHPTLAYAIASALDSGLFADVVVSTDSERYADIARYYGAQVPALRPAEFATAASPDIDWVRHTLRLLASQGRNYECFAILRPTSPFRSVATIRRAMAQFISADGFDSLRAVEKVSQHPGKMWVIRGRAMSPLLPLAPARQPWHSSPMETLPEVYVQNASLEIAWTRVIEETATISGHAMMPFNTVGHEGFDVNVVQDFWYAAHLIERGEAQLPGVSQPCFPDTSGT